MKLTDRQFRKILKEVHPRAAVDNLLFDYGEYVKAEGHVTPASSSVMASFFLTLPDGAADHESHEVLATEYGVDHEDIMADIKRQEAERAAGGLSQEVPHLTGGRKSSWQAHKERQLGESKMRMTKKDILRIIREEAHEYGKDYLSKSHPDGEGELADPELDYDDDEPGDIHVHIHNEARGQRIRMTKRQLRKLIDETNRSLNEDHIDTELDHLQKNVHDDIEHIRDLKDDIHDDHEEELRAEKDKREEDKKKDEAVNRILRRAARRLFELGR